MDRSLKTLRRAVCLALLVAPLATLASARDDYFNAADLDRNGGLSLSEFQAWMSYAFHRMDANGDQVLEVSEQHVANARRLTLAEHHARMAEQFRRQDSNGNGELSQAEFLAPPR